MSRQKRTYLKKRLQKYQEMLEVNLHNLAFDESYYQFAIDNKLDTRLALKNIANDKKYIDSFKYTIEKIKLELNEM